MSKRINKKRIYIVLFSLIISFVSVTSSVQASNNPYSAFYTWSGQTTLNCTWYAWERAYVKTGVELPAWGNAQNWYQGAINAGYSVGQEARADSIAVWGVGNDGYGHVAYVESVTSVSAEL